MKRQLVVIAGLLWAGGTVNAGSASRQPAAAPPRPSPSLVRRLTQPGDDNVKPQWMPDSKRIVYLSDRDGATYLFVMNADGSEQRVFAKTSEDEVSFAVAPNGKIATVATSKDIKTKKTVWTLRVHDADGRAPRTLRRSPEPIGSLAWHPDGRRLCFSTATKGGPSEEAKMMSSPTLETNPEFEGQFEEEDDQIRRERAYEVRFCLIDTDPATVSQPRVLSRTKMTGSEDGELLDHARMAWSPDGKTLACLQPDNTPIVWLIEFGPDGKQTIKRPPIGNELGVTMAWGHDNRLWLQINGNFYRLDKAATRLQKFFAKSAQGAPFNLIPTRQGNVVFYRMNMEMPKESALALLQLVRPANAPRALQFKVLHSLAHLIRPEGKTRIGADWLDNMSLSPDGKNLLFTIQRDGDTQIYSAPMPAL